MNTNITTANANRRRVHAYYRVGAAEQEQKGNSLADLERRLRKIAGRDHPDDEFALWIGRAEQRPDRRAPWKAVR